PRAPSIRKTVTSQGGLNMKGLVSWIGFATFVALVSLAPPSPAKEDADTKLGERLLEAKAVYQELLSTPDRSVPEQLQENCKCIVVIPGMIKGALGFGARWGKGVMSCRNGQGGWSPPIFVSCKGGSWGLPIGAQDLLFGHNAPVVRAEAKEFLAALPQG